MTEFEEAKEVVEELNQLLWDKYQLNEAWFELRYSVGYIVINFIWATIEILVYCSEDNDRIFIEKTNEYEPLIKYVKRIWRKELTKLNKIKL